MIMLIKQRNFVCRLSILMAEQMPPLTQTRLIEESKLSSHTISKLYNNTFSRLDKETVEKLCEYFRCNISDLFDLR